MPSEGTDQARERLLAYRLGELAAGELAEIDERLLRDDHFAAALEAARVELLDEYALGEGSHSRRERIARALNLTGEQDASVRFARALAQQLATPSDTLQARARSAAPRGSMRWALMLAASVVLAMGLWRYSPWRQSPGVRTPPAAAPFTLLLRPEQLRSTSGAQILHVPPAVQRLRVQIVLRRGVTRAEVDVRGAGRVVRRDHLRIRALAGRPFVQFELPRRTLPAGAYRITVRSVRRGQAWTERYWVDIASP